MRDEHLKINLVEGRQSIQLTDQLTIQPYFVPHRQEWSDTIGLAISGPTRRALYIPDIDRWGDWECDIREVVLQCDIALLDGCFFSADELPGRDMSQVPHPLIAETMELLSPSPRWGEGRHRYNVGVRGAAVYFTHLNHTNPAIDAHSPQRREIEARGFFVAEERMEFVL